MPRGDIVLTSVFGHTELKLELGEVIAAGNQLSARAKVYSVNGVDASLNFTGVTASDGHTMDNGDVVRVVFRSESRSDLAMTPVSGSDPYRVDLVNRTDDLYARHVGETAEDLAVAYLVKNETDSTKYDLIVAGVGGVQAPADASYMLYNNRSSLTSSYRSFMCAVGEIDLSGLHTDIVTNMSYMFFGVGYINNLPSLDVSGFNTSNVTDMSNMFFGVKAGGPTDCKDFVNWDTSKVENMYRMFAYWDYSQYLDLSGWDTSSVTNMGEMFSYSYLSGVNLSGWDTSNVTNMYRMFYSSRNISRLEIGNFEIYKAEDLTRMFYNLGSRNAAVEIDGVFDFGPSPVVTIMAEMFYSSKITSLTFAEGSTFEHLTSTNYMFRYCDKLTTVTMRNWTFGSSMQTLDRMFAVAYNLSDVDLSGWTLERTVNLSNMFGVSTNDYAGPISVNLSGWTLAGSTDYQIFVGGQRNFEVTVEVGDSPSPSLCKLVNYQDESRIGTFTVTQNGETVLRPISSPSTLSMSSRLGGALADAATVDAVTADAAELTTAEAAMTTTSKSSPELVYHDTATAVGTMVQYRIWVQYIGDDGAQSGTIQVSFPIPEGVRVLSEAELADVGEGAELIEWGAPSLIDPEGDEEIGGTVVGGVLSASYDVNSNSLIATVEGLSSGRQIPITIWCVLENTDRQPNNYYYWDGIVSGEDAAAATSLQSNIYRLWDLTTEPDPVPPAELTYTLAYEYQGEAPADAVLPEGAEYHEGDEVTLETPVSTDPKFVFGGWSYYDAEGILQKVEGDTFTMPNHSVTLIGTWTSGWQEPSYYVYVPRGITLWDDGDNLDKNNSDEYAGASVQIRYKTEKEENEAAIQPVVDVAVEPGVTLESSSGEENRIMTAKVYNVNGDELTQPSDDIAEGTVLLGTLRSAASQPAGQPGEDVIEYYLNAQKLPGHLSGERFTGTQTYYLSLRD